MHAFPTMSISKIFESTPPKTNIAPENRPLEKGIPIGNHHFQVRTVSFREGKSE